LARTWKWVALPFHRHREVVALAMRALQSTLSGGK
jgi:hypothetical protein